MYNGVFGWWNGSSYATLGFWGGQRAAPPLVIPEFTGTASQAAGYTVTVSQRDYAATQTQSGFTGASHQVHP